MNTTEVHAILMMLSLNYDRQIPTGLPDVWAATLGDLRFDLCKDATLELIKTSAFFPKVAEVRDRARLIREERDRADRRRRQIAAHDAVPEPYTGRTGRAMCALVLGRLRDAGQNPAKGQFLGKQRAADIAEDAVRDWLARTPEGAP